MAATLPVGPVGEDQDELLASARGFVIRSDRASISAIQRFLRIGYNRAARLIETLETEGVITAPGPDGTRHVLATL
nr:DNA translocase FtsK [Pseudomonas indica]